MNRRFLVIGLLVLMTLALIAGAAFAQDGGTKRVGLVIGFPDGNQHIEIVSVPEDATTFDVLQAADIDLASTNTGLGPAICGINNVGCPVENCFCDAAHFWAYYHLNAGSETWTSAMEGAGSFDPADEAVEGFAWSGFDENFNPTVQPPVYTFAQIEAETTPEPVSIPEPGTLLLVGSGLVGLAAYARVRMRRPA